MADAFQPHTLTVYVNPDHLPLGGMAWKAELDGHELKMDTDADLRISVGYKRAPQVTVTLLANVKWVEARDDRDFRKTNPDVLGSPSPPVHNIPPE